MSGAGDADSSSFERRVVSLPPGATLETEPGEWTDALVTVTGGRVSVCCEHGTWRTFGDGDMLPLSWLPLRTLHNPGREAVVLTAVRRRPVASTDA